MDVLQVKSLLRSKQLDIRIHAISVIDWLKQITTVNMHSKVTIPFLSCFVSNRMFSFHNSKYYQRLTLKQNAFQCFGFKTMKQITKSRNWCKMYFSKLTKLSRVLLVEIIPQIACRCVPYLVYIHILAQGQHNLMRY